MKINFLFPVFFGFFMLSSAFAQFENIGKITSKSECNRRCNKGVLEFDKTKAELIKLQEKYRHARSEETDPEKLKVLGISEKKELEKFHQKCEAACEDVCRNNPD